MGGSSAKPVSNSYALLHGGILPALCTVQIFLQKWISELSKDIIPPFPEFNLTPCIQVFGGRKTFQVKAFTMKDCGGQLENEVTHANLMRSFSELGCETNENSCSTMWKCC